MDIVKILLKKEFSERLSHIKNQKKDIAGMIFNAVLLFVMIGAFVAVFMYLTKTYSVVKIGYITKTKDRIYEIYTVFYTIVLAVLTFMGIAKLNKNLISSGNLSLLHLPITPFQIFISKMIIVYIELMLTSLVLTLPVAILFATQGYIAGWAVLVSVVLAILLPLVALGVASLFTIPYYYIKKWLNKQFVVQLLVYITIMAGAFFLYSIFLRLVKSLMETGQISFFFNENFVNNLGKFCSAIYPVNLFSAIMVGNNVALNLLFVVLSAGVCGVVCFFLSKFVFSLVRQNKLADRNEFSIVKATKNPKPVVLSLMDKEFKMVLRTPSYAFNYYAIVLSLPLMVVITTNLMLSMMKNLTVFNCDFEIVLCTVCMYSILLNSFCANNISRDGKFYNLLKTYPISPKQIVLSKILFCSITSVISILLTGFVIIFNNQLTILKTLAVVVICLVLNFGIICLATRKDLNTIKVKDGEENSSSTNFLIFWGLVFSVGLVVMSLVMTIFLQTKLSLRTSNLITCGVLFLISAIVCGVSIIYLVRKLDKKFKETML
ncbi:MAG: hypothetical protein IJ415_01150 [Clostridia bacterium]|nr:hypothetical protein [Clostridia bacterium]